MSPDSRRGALLLVALLLAVAPTRAQQPKRPPATQKPPVRKAAPAPALPATPEPPDLLIASRYTTGDKVTTSTIAMQGSRERIAYEGDLISVQQCDNSRGLQLNTKTRTYLEMPFEKPAASPTPTTGAKRKGGQITYTTTIADTKETREMFGFTARHLKTAIVKEAGADACDKKPERVEIDGWYIDLPATTTCTGAPPVASGTRIDPNDAACRDEVTFVRPATAAGFPLAYSMTTTAGSDAPVTTAMEVTDLKRTTADPQQFDIPSDYVPVKTVAQLTADHRPGEDGPKKPDTIRIGVAPIANKSGQEIATTELVQALSESLSEVEPDIVLLRSDAPEALDVEARARACHFILQNTIAELKKPGKGMMSKLSGTGDSLSARVDFALAAPGQPKPVYAASEKSGGSMLQSAMGTARRVSRIVLPLMMGRYNYMTAFMAMSGNASSAAMQQAQDPVLSSVFALVDRATGAKQQETYTSEEAAVAAALEKEVASLSAQLKRKKS